MKILFKKVYKFDWDKSKPAEIPVDPRAKDFNDYISELIEAVLDDNRRKRYLFPNHDTATSNGIKQVLDEEKDNAALNFAKRLLTVEMAVEGRIEHLDREVQKGIMLQALVEREEKRFFLIIKAEHADFINESDNKKATGLPIKKKIFKAFSAQIDKKDKLKYAFVSDYRTSISTYWWSTFLELEEEYTDDHNTVEAFKAIDTRVLDRIKSAYPSDYMYLRNATVQYFRANKEFVMADYVHDLYGEYVPEDDSLDVEDLRRKIVALPEKAGFDDRFNIKKDKIRKRIIKKLPLTDQLDLIIKEDIEWGEDVKAVKVDGAKYLRIRSNEGYDFFNKKAQK